MNCDVKSQFWNLWNIIITFQKTYQTKCWFSLPSTHQSGDQRTKENFLGKKKNPKDQSYKDWVQVRALMVNETVEKPSGTLPSSVELLDPSPKSHCSQQERKAGVCYFLVFRWFHWLNVLFQSFNKIFISSYCVRCLGMYQLIKQKSLFHEGFSGGRRQTLSNNYNQ